MPPPSAAEPESLSERRPADYYSGSLLTVALAVLAFAFAALSDVARGEPVFGSEPGGQTLGGPGQTVLKGGASKELFSFLHTGPTPSRFVCVTGLNVGEGVVSVIFKSRIGQTLTAKFSPGDSRVVCGVTTAIDVECQGQATECKFRWRLDNAP